MIGAERAGSEVGGEAPLRAPLSWVCIVAPAHGSSAVDARIPFVVELATGSSRPLSLAEVAVELEVIAENRAVYHRVLSAEGGRSGSEPAMIDAVLSPVIDAESPVGRYRLSATLVVHSLLDGDAPLQIGLTVVVSGRDLLAISERSFLSLFPRHTWFDARGGFSYPTARSVAGDSILIEGWAVRRSDRVERVEIYFGSTMIGGAKIGLSSPEQHRNLPVEPESSRCRFSLWVKRDDVARRLGSEALLEQSVSVKARCVFVSGMTLTLDGPQVRFLPDARTPHGRIEGVREAGEGLVEISGYLFHEDLASWQFFLEGRAWRLPLHEGAELASVAYEEAEECWPMLARSRPCGFRVRVHPAALGRFPGVIRLCAESADRTRRVELGPPEMTEAVTAAMHRALVFVSSTERIKSCASRALCRAGFRKRFPLGAEPAERRSGLPSRILVASHNLSAVEGAPKALLLALEGLLAAGVAPDGIRVVSGADGELRSRLDELDIAVDVRPQLQPTGRTWRDFHRGVEAVAEAYGDWGAELVLANVIDSFWAVDYAYRARIPSLFWIHESIAPFEWLPDLDPRLRLLLFERLRSTATLFVAESTRRLFRGFVRRSRSWIVRNSVKADDLSSSAAGLDRDAVRRSFGLSDRFVVTVIGTTTWRKGQDVLVNEVAELKALRPEIPIHVLLVGARDLPFLRQLQDQVEALGLSESVSFIAETPDVAPYYVASDVIAVPSREESSPLVTLEAFAFARPVVSTAVFGLAEQLEGGRNALVVSLQEPGSLGRAVAQLYDRPELGEYLVTGGLETLSRFTVEATHSGFVDAVRGAFESYEPR